jgi:von Willebrand factor type A domain
MAIRNFIASALKIAVQVRFPGFGKIGIMALTVVFTQCMTDDRDTDGKVEEGSGDMGPLRGTDSPGGIPGNGGDSTLLPQSGQLTAGEIDDHLNYPQFKTYVQRALQAAQTPGLELSLPDGADVKDRFEGVASRPKALDLAFAIDATGSMGDEMSYLAAEFQSIVGRIQGRHPDLSIRYGLVFYRDQGDDFVVKSHAFRSSVEETQAILLDQKAGGGGDTPEAMDEGLKAAAGLDWRGRSAATQMLFLVADAPPHQASIVRFLNEVDKAVAKGIRIYPLAASSTDELTELLLRIAAFQSSGSYSFLTNDSRIGNDHKEPSIPCYLVTRLDGLLTRLIESEIAGARIEPQPSSILRTSGHYEKGRCQEGQAADAS